MGVSEWFVLLLIHIAQLIAALALLTVACFAVKKATKKSTKKESCERSNSQRSIDG